MLFTYSQNTHQCSCWRLCTLDFISLAIGGALVRWSGSILTVFRRFCRDVGRDGESGKFRIGRWSARGSCSSLLMSCGHWQHIYDPTQGRSRQKTRRLKQFLNTQRQLIARIFVIYLLTDINMLLRSYTYEWYLACKAEAVANEAVAKESLAAEDQLPP